MSVTTIACEYTGEQGVAAAYLAIDGDEAAFVETNTNHATERLLASLAQAGMRAEQVRYIIITHVHLDHAGGAGSLMAACPNATLLAHPRAAPHVIDPSRIVKGSTAVYGARRFAELYGEIRPVSAERVQALEDGETRTLGHRTLSLLHTRGHANHHFCIHDDGANGVFTGDSFGILYPALQRYGLLCFPSTTPTDFDGPAALASLDRIVQTGAERVWPTHMGEYTRVNELAQQLRPQLEAYINLVDEADASDRDGEKLDQFCHAQIAEMFRLLLDQHGLGSDRQAHALVSLDLDLNAQGVAFAVRKRRYKRATHPRN